jgi:dolichol-phosphate mannosyltransferase
MANEEAGAARFVADVLARCTGFKSVKFFAVLDRVSKDRTRPLLEDYAQSESNLQVVWAPENRCVVDAYVRGYREALAHECDWILEIDAGFSHLPEDIPQFFDTMSKGYDCVFGSRFSPGGVMKDCSLKRVLISRGGTVLANLLLGTRLKDMTGGFELFSADALRRVLSHGLMSRGPFFQTEIKFHCRGLRIAEVPIRYMSASHNVGKSALMDALRNLFRLRRLKFEAAQ